MALSSAQVRKWLQTSRATDLANADLASLLVRLLRVLNGQSLTDTSSQVSQQVDALVDLAKQASLSVLPSLIYKDTDLATSHQQAHRLLNWLHGHHRLWLPLTV